VEILPDSPWHFQCTLENPEYKGDTVRSMLVLESGQTYRAQTAGCGSSFHGGNMVGKRSSSAAVMRIKKRQWKIDSDELGILRVEEIGEPVMFAVVE
jgi:hypothetical protein